MDGSPARALDKDERELAKTLMVTAPQASQATLHVGTMEVLFSGAKPVAYKEGHLVVIITDIRQHRVVARQIARFARGYKIRERNELYFMESLAHELAQRLLKIEQLIGEE